MLTSQVALCQGKGARSQRAKNRTEPFPGEIGQGILNLVALALTVTELFNKVCEKESVFQEDGSRRGNTCLLLQCK